MTLAKVTLAQTKPDCQLPLRGWIWVADCRALGFRTLVLCSLILVWAIGARGAVTTSQRQQLEQMQKELAEAGKLFAESKFGEAAKRVNEIQAGLLKLLRESSAATGSANSDTPSPKGPVSSQPTEAIGGPDPALLRLAKPIYSSLQRAHALLELEGLELEALPKWENLSATSPSKAAGKIDSPSFVKDISPLLVAKCGACHIDSARGEFSMSSFANLMRGDKGGIVVRPGSSLGSRIVEVIETGDMPRGNNKVTPEELSKLKLWIDGGAKFDGPSPDVPMKSYSASATTSPSALDVTVPTGKELVLFTRDIAPILLENCNGCHLTSQQISGQLRMDTIGDLLRGGNSGAVIVKHKPQDSLLIKKLKGEAGLRMPAGDRPPLSDDKIRLISTWIQEGATFDGPNANLPLSTIVAQRWAAAASHGELFAKREERALVAWQKILPNIEPTILKNNEMVMFGNVSELRLAEIFKMSEAAIAETKRFAKIGTKEPLIRGGLVMYVFRGQYEYSEHGKMNEQRQLPVNWRGHWTSTPLDVYGAMIDAPDIEPKQQAALHLQVVSGAYLGSLPQVPLWFAEGIARNLAAVASGRNDPRTLAWQQGMLQAVQKVERPEILLNGQLDEESAGLVGMNITRVLMDRANRKRLDAFIKLLRDGQPFPQAMKLTFAPPDQLVKSWLGKK